MIAPGFAGVETQLWIWLIAMIRPGAAFLAAPVFGAPAMPLQLRLILSLALGMAALNSVTPKLRRSIPHADADQSPMPVGPLADASFDLV